MFGLACIWLWVLASLWAKDYNRGHIIKKAEKEMNDYTWYENAYGYEHEEIVPLIEECCRCNREENFK